MVDLDLAIGIYGDLAVLRRLLHCHLSISFAFVIRNKAASSDIKSEYQEILLRPSTLF